LSTWRRDSPWEEPVDRPERLDGRDERVDDPDREVPDREEPDDGRRDEDLPDRRDGDASAGASSAAWLSGWSTVVPSSSSGLTHAMVDDRSPSAGEASSTRAEVGGIWCRWTT